MSEPVDAILIILVGVYVVSLVYGAVSDLHSLEIPNRVSLVLALAFLPAAWLAGLDILKVAQHCAVAGAVFLLGAMLFARGIIGGGDVKLLAAAVVWQDLSHLAAFLIVMSLCGGGLALFVLISRRYAGTPWVAKLMPWIGNEGGAGQPVPYGVAIAAAALILLPRLPVLPASLQEWL